MYLAFHLFVPLLFKIHILLSMFISHVVSTVMSEPPNVTGLIEARAPASFKHPGVLLDLHRLNYIRSHVKAKNDPWKKAFDALLHSSFGSLNRRAHPRANVECGFYSVPNFGCFDEIHDALSAYAVSLLWFITGEKKYAQKSIYYMNAWSKVIRSHGNKNAQVQAGWASASWTKAAEIIRHTNGGWATKDVQRFEAMLRNAYLPLIRKGAPPGYNGNWELGIFQMI